MYWVNIYNHSKEEYCEVFECGICKNRQYIIRKYGEFNEWN